MQIRWQRCGEPGGQCPSSPIYEKPILETHKAKTIFEVKLFMAAGYDGLDTSTDKTMIVFGDAKKVVEAMLKAV